MDILVSNIVEVSMTKIALWIRIGADDWTTERTIITSNGDAQLEPIQYIAYHVSGKILLVKSICTTVLYIAFNCRQISREKLCDMR